MENSTDTIGNRTRDLPACNAVIAFLYFTQSRKKNQLYALIVDRDSSVDIATAYGLDGPGIESRGGGENFRTCPDRPWGPPSLIYNDNRVFPGDKNGRSVALTTHPPPPSAEV